MYNKEKALQILQQMLQGETNENIITAIEDQTYGLTLGLVAYSQQLHLWHNIKVNADADTKEYWESLHSIHSALVLEGVFAYNEQI